MKTITILPADITVTVAPGTTILEVLRANAVALDAPCNGLGTCGKCKVRVSPTKASAASALEVLACDVRVEDDLVVSIPDRSGQDRVLLTGTRCQRPLKSRATRRPNVTTPMLGAAVDIGTTTLVISLVDLETGQARATLGSLNPQTRYGHDVLSRIQHASSPEGLEQLRRVVVDELNRLLSKTAERSRTSPDSIVDVCLSGNTTMLHLVTGTDPESLGRYPYTPRITGHSSHLASNLGLHVAPESLVYLPPIFDGFVGADITSGVLATELHQRHGATLLIDIGTNGEMVLAVDGRLVATSTAAGPAFEGMNITCGMRATDGAIERVAIDEGGNVQLTSIGGLAPVGLCGSGLIEAVGQLVLRGVVSCSGRFVKPTTIASGKLRGRVVTHEGKPAFQVATNVLLTQGDVRQVQLAKGALRSGIDQMLLSHGLKPNDVERVLVAGSFGAHLTVESLVTIGLLPAEFADRVEMVGNTSRTGAEAFLLNVDTRDELATVVKQTTVLDLAHAPDFEKRFVSCLAFPSSSGRVAA